MPQDVGPIAFVQSHDLARDVGDGRTRAFSAITIHAIIASGHAPPTAWYPIETAIVWGGRRCRAIALLNVAVGWASAGLARWAMQAIRHEPKDATPATCAQHASCASTLPFEDRQ